MCCWKVLIKILFSELSIIRWGAWMLDSAYINIFRCANKNYALTIICLHLRLICGWGIFVGVWRRQHRKFHWVEQLLFATADALRPSTCTPGPPSRPGPGCYDCGPACTRQTWRNAILNTLRPKQNGPHFAEDIFICIFSMEIIAFWLQFNWILFPKV